jgi:hypothetical protein
MGSVRQEIVVDATPAQTWAAVRDVGAVHLRLTPGHVVATQIEGDTRILTFANGAVVREYIVDIDDAAQRLAYAVIESRMGLQHHHATFDVAAEEDGRSRLIWTTDFLPHARATQIRLTMERGIQDMKLAIEDDARRGEGTG